MSQLSCLSVYVSHFLISVLFSITLLHTTDTSNKITSNCYFLSIGNPVVLSGIWIKLSHVSFSKSIKIA
jgi:hypothetical protein